MMAEPNSVCYGVRRSYFPQNTKIAIGVLAGLVIIINSLAMISVLKNYRRLRQRIYVFVISLAAAEIFAGVIFLSDTINCFIVQKQQLDRGGADVIFQSTIVDGGKYIVLRVNEQSVLTQELLESMKAGAIVLSILNTALVTFALYKRTTSMGRHHEDFKHMSAALGPDGQSFLPAFDTMMRVLSIGSHVVASDLNGKAACSRLTRDGDRYPLRRVSSASRLSSSQQGSSISREGDTVILENYQDGLGSDTRKPQAAKAYADGCSRKSDGRSKSKQSRSLGRLRNTGRRVSQALRSRSTSAAHSYVGRHSYSVMSKRATGCSLFLIWLTFAFVCVLPYMLRRSGVGNSACPEECRSVELSEKISYLRTVPAIKPHTTAAPNEQTEVSPINGVVVDGMPSESEKRRMSEKNESLAYGSNDLGLAEEVSRNNNPNALDLDRVPGNDFVEEVVGSDYQINFGYQQNTTNLNITGCVPINYRPYSPWKPVLTGSLVNTTTPGFGHSTTDETSLTRNSPCSSCSISFYPMSKSHTLFIAIVIFTTWCWLMLSASRLLYLRKHSTNVFVRCSALWRFMFITAIFFFVTMAPHAVQIIWDFVTPSLASQSPLWFSSSRFGVDPDHEVNILTNNTEPELTNPASSVSRDIDSLCSIYGVIATCLVLINFASTPTLYLVRLLGFRRIVSLL